MLASTRRSAERVCVFYHCFICVVAAASSAICITNTTSDSSSRMGQAASAHLTGLGTQLIKASKAGDADAVTELVSSNPQLLRYCTFRHLGPCHYAARGDHVEVLQQLVAKAQEIEQLQWQAAAAASGARAHARLVGSTTPATRSPTAAGPNSSSLVKQLVNATSDRGVTPLMFAVDGGCAASVKLLLEKVRVCMDLLPFVMGLLVVCGDGYVSRPDSRQVAAYAVVVV